jgi:dTDP-4-amino-4,6-dideoxygalactose transaminase
MIRLCKPCTDHSELEAVKDVLESGNLTQGRKVEQFEKMIADYVGTEFAFATSSCTTALHLSLVALGIGPGDEVLVPDFTFPATANVVVQQQAIPILVDIDLDTLTVDIDDMESKLTAKTKAIIPVHAFGLSADMDPIMGLAKEHGFAVIEDAACALGASYKGKKCGSLGDLGCFSFHPRKSITTCEGGMITTNDHGLAARIKILRSHGGIQQGRRFTFESAGFNYRLSEVHGSIGIRQMEKLDWILDRRKNIAIKYSENLGNNDSLRIPQEPDYGNHTYQSYVVLLDKRVDRDLVISELYERGMETTIGTYALHSQPYFRRRFNYSKGDLENSQQAYERSLTLPLYVNLSEKEHEYVIESILDVAAVRNLP